MMPPQLLTGIADAASGIVKGLMGGLDKLFTSKEEKAAAQAKLEQIAVDMQKEVQGHLERMTLMAIDETKAYLADTQDARANNAKIQESEKASWLAKNVAYIIDLFLTGLWGLVTIILFLKIFKIAAAEVDMISLMALHGTVTAVFMTVLNFHRGTSRGSEDKGKQLNMVYNKRSGVDLTGMTKEQLEEELKKRTAA
jgi:hypothetical protein